MLCALVAIVMMISWGMLRGDIPPWPVYVRMLRWVWRLVSCHTRD